MLDMMILGIVAWAFWLFVGLGCLVIWSVDKENGWGAFFGLVAAGVVAHFAHVIDFYNVFSNWQNLLIYIGVYIAIGVGWTFVKWIFYTNGWANDKVEQIQELRQQFLKENRISSKEIPDNLKDKWMAYRQNEMRNVFGRYVEISEEIKLTHNIERILIWCVYWPFSMLWTLIDDPVRAVCKFIIFKVFGGVMQFFSQRAAKRVEDELFK
jgi:hypothetical protein